MFTKLSNIVLCAVFLLDKMMGEVVENANNFRLILPKPKFACACAYAWACAHTSTRIIWTVILHKSLVLPKPKFARARAFAWARARAHTSTRWVLIYDHYIHVSGGNQFYSGAIL